MTRHTLISTIVFVCWLQAATLAFGQLAAGTQPVVIERRMVRLTPPDAYQFAVSLEASRQLTMTAPFEGRVRTVSARPGGKVLPQAELIALESQRLELTHQRALAALDVAEGSLRVARLEGKPEVVKLGEAQVALAQADLALTSFDKEQTSLRTPREATVLKVHVQEGQEVRKGDPLVTIGNLTSLECRVPVDRKAAKAGQAITLTVEDSAVVGLVQSLEPVSDERQRLRDLAVSVAMAVVSVRNTDGKMSPGQSVFPNIVPSDPVTRVPLTSVGTASDGGRHVQVLRDHIVRNVPVQLHGQIGKGDVFVSGPFTELDLVITSTSVELADSTAVKPSTARASGATAGTSAASGTVGARQSTTTTPARKTGAAGF